MTGTGANSSDDSFVINPIFNGGTGARAKKDGLSTTAFPSGVRTTSAEVNEATSPLVIWKKEYTPDSGGAGAQRGGLGQTIEIGHRHEASFVISKMFDRIHHPARGRHGGEHGQPGAVYITDGDVRTDLPGKGRDEIPSGMRLVMQTPGGGGAGDPSQRTNEAKQQDIESGLITQG